MSENAAKTPAAGDEFDLPKQYRPLEHEGRMWSKWMEARAFHADPERVLRGEARPYCVLIPPPNVTAALHLGHALNNTLQDVLVRAHRMMGYEALWMPGTDHAGIATQAVMEKRLRKEGKLKGALKQGMEREAFVAQVQAFKDEYEGVITGQLKAMGCSCDWDRQRFTMDDICARAVREAFFRLFKDGLIYRGKRLVNWDPALQTAVADDECYDEEIEGAFYYLRYPLVHAHGATTEKERAQGKSPPGDAVPVTWGELAARGYPGAEEREAEQAAWVTVATTRPETYLGDTAVAVNPHDPRAKSLRGLSVELPIVGRVIPVIEDAYVVLPERYARTEEEKSDPKAKMATGFLKVTPAHDPNDYEIGQRHNLPIVNVMAPDGSISDKHGWGDVGDAHLFVGMKREDARKKVIAEFKARTVGGEPLFEKSTPTRHSVKHSDRSKAIVEPYLSDQWYVRVTDPRMARAANEALAEEQRSGGGALGPGGTGVPPVSSGSGPGGTGVPPVTSGDPYHRLGTRSANLTMSHRNLPHFEQGGSTYLVTFCTAGATLSDSERRVVLDACRHWHGQRMELHAAVVMPDHVHLLLSPFEESSGRWHSLAELLHSIKSFSAHQIGKARGTGGPIWQDESHDRLVRRREEYLEKVGYIQQNPVDAGLAKKWTEYPYIWVSELAKRGRVEFLERIRGRAWCEKNAAMLGVHGREPVQWDDEHRRDACATETGKEEEHRRDACATGTNTEHRRDACATGTGQMRFFPARYAKTFEQWHDGIRDWCISRQLWWGHRIPVWTVAPETNHGKQIPDFVTQGPEFLAELRTRLDRLEQAWGMPGCLAVQDLGWDAATRRYGICVRTAAAASRWEVAAKEVNRGAVWHRPGQPIPLPPPFGSAEETCAVIDLKEVVAQVNGQDPDVLDTWFSSALWPMSTMGWPDTAQSARDDGRSGGDFPALLKAFNPSTTLSTAREIITLWVSRMTMFNRYFMGEGQGKGPAPFKNVFIHAVVQDGDGRKMSKSLGNGVDPLDIIATHGADAMRFTLCQMATNTQDVRMPVRKDAASGKNTSEKFDLGRNFATKLWNAARFAIAMLKEGEKTEEHRRDACATGTGREEHRRDACATGTGKGEERGDLPSRWMLSRLAAGIGEINGALANFEFHVYAQTLYDLVWRDFCDWYLEAIKPTAAADAGQRAALREALVALLKLAHPVMPFITEAIWEKVPGAEGLLCRAPWPGEEHRRDACATETGREEHRRDACATGRGRDEEAEAEFERMRGVVSAVREVRAQHTVAFKRKVTLHVPADAGLAGVAGLISTLAGLERMTTDAPAGPSVAFSLEGAEYRVSNLADAVDAGAERARLEKQAGDLEKQIGILKGRLANPGYAERAPAAMVQQTKDQLAKAEAELTAVRQRMESA